MSMEKRPTAQDLQIEANEQLRQRNSQPGLKPGMLYIPEGAFSVSLETRITVPAFWIDRAPVTNAQYAQFLEKHPDYQPPFNRYAKELSWTKASRWSRKYVYPEGQANHPVVLVSWFDACKYAEWLHKRLPTQYEWLKAGMGVLGRPFPWGWSPPTPIVCNMRRNGTTPIGTFSPQGNSIYGCEDMAGNVDEWIGDDYGVVLGKTEKTLLGGYSSNLEWSDECGPRRLYIASSTTPDRKWMSIGFRCAADV